MRRGRSWLLKPKAVPITLGDVELYILSDGTFRSDGGAHFGLVPRVLWEKVISPDALNRIPVALNCLLIVSRGVRILVDTGYGHKLTDKQRTIHALERPEGDVLAALGRLGLRPHDIDIVINTHLHADHCSGNTKWAPASNNDPVLANEQSLYSDEGRRRLEAIPTFPRAQYCVQRLEWADACFPNERTRGTYFAENFRPLEAAGQLRLLNGDTYITPEVRCIVTRGHTRAHQSVVIESQGQTAIYLGDAAPTAVSLERLAWIAAFDVEPLESLETKRGLREWALQKNALLFFEHDVRISVGRLCQEGEGYRVVGLP